MRVLLNSLVTSHFPQVRFAVGYGSAVFKQANYDAPNLVIDMLLVVDDLQRFHEQNLAMNSSHYSYLAKRVPTSLIAAVNESGSGIYFNPLIPLKSFNSEDTETRQIKYGVIQYDQACEDLALWKTFGLAGRL